MNHEKLTRQNVALVVIDVQEKLAPHIVNSTATFKNIERLIRFAHIVGIPIVLTEQRGLGPTLGDIRSASGVEPIEKTAFSCFGDSVIRSKIGELGHRTLILAGIEAHICVAQTALDGMGNFNVHVVADAVSSRSEQNRTVALDRLRNLGLTLTSTEMFIYEVACDSSIPEFRDVLRIVK